MRGVGIHVFAGGFTRGIRTVLPVVGQLEIHNFGRGTVEAMGLPFMNANTWQNWSDYKSTWKDCTFCYGNPRCTSFSSYSSGGTPDVRGPRAKPTQDIWDLCNFGVTNGFKLLAFESVQQAYTVGRSLLNMLRDKLFAPNGYRIAHVFVNTAAEGNAQRRRRYFFVAYKKERNFNVMLPVLPKYRVTVDDVLSHHVFKKMKVHADKLNGKNNVDYDVGSYTTLTPDERKVVPCLRQGEDTNTLARRRPHVLKEASSVLWKRWINRSSDIPFSLHTVTRVKGQGHCPTISSTSGRLIHPTRNRPLSVGEIAGLMGWPIGTLPVGPEPIGQIGKGVVPATGAWLAKQIKLYFENAWSDEDFESTWDHNKNVFVGRHFDCLDNPPMEKTFNLTHYLPLWKETQRV